MTFNQLDLLPEILKALDEEGYSNPTPVQEQAIPKILKRRDMLGCAQTGTGKTAAFAIPILQLITEDYKLARKSWNHKPVHCLILTPTRELAIQIGESFKAYGRHLHIKHTVIFGGVGQTDQVNSLRKGPEILIATPGRLLDLIQQGFIRLNELDYFVLDEADRMLDMGFIHDVKRILKLLPAKRQSLFFSATMPAPIQQLANGILTQPEKVEVTPVSSTAETVKQWLYYVDKPNKRKLLAELLSDDSIERALVFTRTKHGADRVARDLNKAGIKALAIHGDKSQGARQNALNQFREKSTKVLVATDIAARGIDIDELNLVINFEIPNVPETYVHRIGRTGRAGLKGTAYSFCDSEEKAFIRDIEKTIGRKIPVQDAHAFPMTGYVEEPKGQQSKQANSNRSPRQSNSSKRPSKNSYGRKPAKPTRTTSRSK